MTEKLVTCLKDINTAQICLLCLTRSASMVPFSSKVEVEKKKITVVKIIETFFRVKIIEGGNFPKFVCGLCLGFLKISYEFYVKSFNSFKVLEKKFNYEGIGIIIDAKENKNQFGNVKNEEKNGNASKKEEEEETGVDLWIQGKKFSLKDLLIVEDNTNNETSFSGFLKNLGTEVSATYTKENPQPLLTRASQEPEISLFPLQQEEQPGAEEVVLEFTLVQDDPSNEFLVKETGEIIAKPSSEATPKMCIICCKTFNSTMQLIQHTKQIHIKPKLICDVCGHVCYSRQAMRRHKIKHQGKQFKCNICGKEYYDRNVLKEHVNNVHLQMNDGKYLCSVCGRCFNRRTALTYHIKSNHNKERNCLCRYCGMAFCARSALNQHIRRHTGEKPYSCSTCGKAFSSASMRKKHELLHTNARPFKCCYCQKSYTTRWGLKVHKSTHPGEFSCDSCNKSFIESIFLQEHMQNHHKTIEVECLN